jgi:4-nitrophenol 2-monooxygenase / 4-nitrocatechol 4-monooxygenase, reductase component
VRLAGDRTVSRTADSRFVPTPVTVEVADQMFAARCVVELGVADTAVEQVAETDLAVLDGFATRLARIVADDTSTLAEFLDTSHRYHRHFVGLSRSPQLSDTYERLGISALWREAIAAHDWRHMFDVAHHAELTRACRDGDVSRARQLIMEHTEQVRRLVRDVIDRAGGAL